MADQEEFLDAPSMPLRHRREPEPIEPIPPLASISSTPSPPDRHLEDSVGKYLHALELLADFSMQVGRHELSANILFGLIKLTKLGRPKAEVTLNRPAEMDLSKASPEELESILRLTKGEREE